MVADGGLAKTTKSIALSIECFLFARQSRKLSRTTRFIRFRSTALLSTFRETAIPRRGSILPDGRAIIRKQQSEDATFFLKTRLKSDGFESLAERGSDACPLLFSRSPCVSSAIMSSRPDVPAFMAEV
jgi:hypothetical protein